MVREALAKSFNGDSGEKGHRWPFSGPLNQGISTGTPHAAIAARLPEALDFGGGDMFSGLNLADQNAAEAMPEIPQPPPDVPKTPTARDAHPTGAAG